MTQHPDLPVAVIGAGPVGLAAAAWLHERGIATVVLEAGQEVGSSIRQWGHVRLFSPWRFNTDRSARRLLAANGWREPDGQQYPTGHDFVDEYLAPLAATPELQPVIRMGARVTAITRAGVDKVRSDGREDQPFVLSVGDERLLARAVIDASGTWLSPNPLGAGGVPAPGEQAAAGQIVYGIPDVLGSSRERYAGKTTLVVGNGHSAQNTIADLAELARERPGTRVVWAVRRAPKFGGGDDDQLAARGRLGDRARALVASGAVELVTGFGVERITSARGRLEAHSVEGSITGLDEIVAATGFRPDLGLLRELRTETDPVVESTRALAPLIDPNVHSCGSVPPHGAAEVAHPEPGLYVVGVKSYGRAPTFLALTGYEQARSVVAQIASDHEAAADVRLELPETGVCSTRPEHSGLEVLETAGAAGCCG